jgi:hypothetical protein
MFGIDPTQGPWRFMTRTERAFMYTVAFVFWPYRIWYARRNK